MTTIFAKLVEEFKDRDLVQRWATWHKWAGGSSEGEEDGFRQIERRYKQLYADVKAAANEAEGGGCCKKK